MAGDWIKMTKDLPDKPEVWRMAGVLGIDADSVVGKLLRVWAWFDSHTEDGNAVGVTYPLLDRIAGVNGFAEAMAISGWLEQNGHTMYLPNFDRHNGKTAKNRALTNERVAKSRTKQQESNADSNGASVTKTVTREEKRREEENPLTPKGGLSRFEDFWNAWPKSERKQDKVKCAKKWRTSGLDSQADEILADIAIKQQTQKWLGGYIEAPLVYLNGARWNDGVTPEDGANGSRSPSSALAGAI